MVEKTQGFGEFFMHRFGQIVFAAAMLAGPAFSQDNAWSQWQDGAGACYDQTLDAQKRVEGCSTAITLSSNPSVDADFEDVKKLRLDRASVYLALKDYPKAIADADAAQKIDQYDVRALNMQCWTRGVANVELEKAHAACTEAIRVNKDEPASFDSRGLVNLRLGKWAEAFEDYRVAARFLTMPFSRYGAGLAVLAYGLDMPRGEGLISSALERDPKAGDELNALGFTPEKMKTIGAKAKPN